MQLTSSYTIRIEKPLLMDDRKLLWLLLTDWKLQWKLPSSGRLTWGLHEARPRPPCPLSLVELLTDLEAAADVPDLRLPMSPVETPAGRRMSPETTRGPMAG